MNFTLKTHLKPAMKLGVTTARLTTLLSSRSSERVWKAHSHCIHWRGTQPSSQPQAVQPFLAAVLTGHKAGTEASMAGSKAGMRWVMGANIRTQQAHWIPPTGNCSQKPTG
jgi:hypothetical protein